MSRELDYEYEYLTTDCRHTASKLYQMLLTAVSSGAAHGELRPFTMFHARADKQQTDSRPASGMGACMHAWKPWMDGACMQERGVCVGRGVTHSLPVPH